MSTIEVFLQSEGRRAVDAVEVPEGATVGDLLQAARERGLADDDADVLLEDADDALDADTPLADAGVGVGAQVHIGRRRKVAVTVQFETRSVEARLAPSRRVLRVLKRALKHFEIPRSEAKEYALQLCGTTDRPDLDVHLGALASGPEASVCFDLVLKNRVQG